ncbi:hypothetical protein C8Q74DRAFT_753056 [Fomes fomentarius]|nr:hypothetical protein C8Q74DRAFT_753056 [Fomes fomentarius]
MVPGSASGSSLHGLANDYHSPIYPFCEPRNVLFPVRRLELFPGLWPSDGDDVCCERVVPLRSRTDKVGKARSEGTPPHAVRFVTWIFWHPDLPTVQPPRPRLDIEIPTPGLLLFQLGTISQLVRSRPSVFGKQGAGPGSRMAPIPLTARALLQAGFGEVACGVACTYLSAMWDADIRRCTPHQGSVCPRLVARGISTAWALGNPSSGRKGTSGRLRTRNDTQ